MIEKNLKNKDVKTTMTLDKDKTVSLQERCDISNETRPDLFVSVHVNSSVNSAIYGVETHWWKQDSIALAETVHKHLSKNFNKWKTKDRGLFKSQFYVIIAKAITEGIMEYLKNKGAKDKKEAKEEEKKEDRGE